MRRSSVEKDHLLTFELDRDGGDFFDGPRADAFGTNLIDFASVREDAQIKFGGFFGVVVEPEEREQVYSWLA